MTREKLYSYHPKYLRDSLNLAVEKSDQLHDREKELIELLVEIDRKRLFVRYGYKSMRGFCINGLKFGRAQGQRIVTEVRRCQTTVKIGQEGRLDVSVTPRPHNSTEYHQMMMDL